MARVYVETSYISACVTERTDTASSYRRQTSREWWNTQRLRHDVFVSEEVLAELAHADFRQSEQALEFSREVPILPITPEVRGLAQVLVREKVMPGPLTGDALHVSLATCHVMDYLLTWNVRHLANPNKIEHLQKICVRVGFVPPRIITPELLWESNDE